jgi:hypothetical protein
VLEIIITPIALRVQVPHFVNVQRAIVGVATAHLEPRQLPLAFGGGGQCPILLADVLLVVEVPRIALAPLRTASAATA